MLQQLSPPRRVLATAAVALTLFSTAATGQRMRIGSSNPAEITSSGYADAYFAAADATTGVEVWHHSSSGTVRAVDVYPGSMSSYPGQFTRRSETETWFVARAKDKGRELHYYPELPSANGRVVMDINPAPNVGSNPRKLTLTKELLFFTANDGTTGRELWASDGCTAYRVKDIVPGAGSSHPAELTPVGNNVILFVARDAAGIELWRSDGTDQGTQRVLDIRAGALSSTPTELTKFGEWVYFAARSDETGRELWRTDGTTQNTELIADIANGVASSSPQQLTAGDGLAFTAFTATNKRQLYVLDSSGLTRRSSFASGDIAEITAASGAFWFRARTAAAGHELWRTSGSSVTLVHNLRPGNAGSFPMNLQPYSGGLLFRANNGTSGGELWRTNGTTATLVMDILGGGCGSKPSRLERLGSSSTFLFSATSPGKGIELWQTNGTTASLAKDIDPARPLPRIHLKRTGTTGTITIKEGIPNNPGRLYFAAALGPRIVLPSLRGVLNLNLATSASVGFTFNAFGTATIPAIGWPTGTYQVAMQAVTAGLPGFLEASSVLVCAGGSKTGPPGAEGDICLDDASGHYTTRSKRTDAGVEPMHIGLYFKRPNDVLETIPDFDAVTLEFQNDEKFRSGNIYNQLQLYNGDLPGKLIEMHMFMEGGSSGGPPETPPQPNNSRVLVSYC